MVEAGDGVSRSFRRLDGALDMARKLAAAVSRAIGSRCGLPLGLNLCTETSSGKRSVSVGDWGATEPGTAANTQDEQVLRTLRRVPTPALNRCTGSEVRTRNVATGNREWRTKKGTGIWSGLASTLCSRRP